MDSKELLKKYWFLGLVAVLLVVFVCAYGVSSFKNKEVKVNSLTHDGKDVIFTFNGNQYYYADDLYSDMYKSIGNQIGFTSYLHAVVNEIVPTTTELSSSAASWAAGIVQQVSEEDILSQMLQSGYKSIDDLNDWCLYTLKYQQFMNDVYTNEYDKYVKPIVEEEKPRYVSHILITVADTQTVTDENGNETYVFNPTEEETKKLNDVLDALKKDDRAFEDIATEFSDDGSAANGGQLGLVLNSTVSKYVKPFADACMNAEDGVVTEPIQTVYGWHIIKVETPSTDELLNENEFNNALANANPNLDLKLITDKAKELGFVIKDQNVQDFIDSYLEAE